ncbi:MAG: hypothetical protein AVDCRST_MAG80-63 [uncultured Rubrobacteraceae bacterium]|uniref:DUF4383 domain-containing protein n=1 Tax=uncultured Rubrobacteraceae bacterium TaxID=349277 RepID=A0A6J4PSR6_9ACTN|nr:MAG: hypothetical protein AVDCRST_MAG80-63 [uncultured Rubrobacteraceae bacterium]
MYLAQRFAQIFGAIYLVVGIVGFIPVPPLLVPADFPVIGPLEGFVLGLFAVNWLHSVVHLAIGAAGLASYRSPAAARSYSIGIGVLYLLLFLIGLILPTVFGLVPLNGADNILHLVSGAVALAIGLASSAAGATRAPA